MVALRAAFGDLHQMHDCDQHCPRGCDQFDCSESAYRRHDEHNADVREDIELKAGGLLDALGEWLGADSLASTVEETSC